MKTIPSNNILSIAKSYLNCRKNGNYDWQGKYEQKVTDTLFDKLPSGSGIDCKWEIDILKDRLLCVNSWHIMNDGGYYMGFIDFTVKIDTTKRDIWGHIIFSITGKFKKQEEIRNYLYETIGYALDEL